MKHEVQVEDLVAGMTRTMEKRRMDNHLAFDEGRLAFKSGDTRDANPYRSSSPGFHKWFAGWDEEWAADQMDLVKHAKIDDLRKD